MPELPEVETIARKLRASLIGRSVTRADILWARTIDRPDPAKFQHDVVGASITGVDRRGKYLIVALDTGQFLLVHLRMSGKFALIAAGEAVEREEHCRVIFSLDDGAQLAYIDPRKFGRFYLVEHLNEVIGPLGPEPLDHGTGPGWWCHQLRGRRGEIKRLLLDQAFIAGLGNIYANEALWLARIHPQRTAGSLTEAECHRLHEAVVTVLEQGIRNGGTSLEDRQYVYPNGGLGRHQQYLRVYDREGEACPRCGYALNRIVQGQRSTYYCPVCQQLPGAAAGSERTQPDPK